MRRTLRILAILLCLRASAPAQEPPAQPSPERLAELNAAIACITVLDPGTQRPIARGAGVLIHKEGAEGMLVTSASLVTSQWPTSEVQFLAGKPGEFQYAATLKGFDASRGLAFLRLWLRWTGNPNELQRELPAPVDFSRAAALKEGQAAWVLGFPSETPLPDAKRSPVSRVDARVSAPDADGRAGLQGKFPPGLSGGLVLDASGNVLGLATAVMRQGAISSVTPAAQVAEDFQGRMLQWSKSEAPGAGAGAMRVTVSAGFLDPRGLIRTAILRVGPKAKTTVEEPLSGEIVQIRGSFEGPAFQAVATLQGPPEEPVVYRFQLQYQRADGKTMYTKTEEFSVDFMQAYPKLAKEVELRKLRAAAVPGKPAETGKALTVRSSTAEGVTIRQASIEPAPGPARLLWSTRQQQVWVLAETGTLLEISVPGMVELRRLDLGRPAKQLLRSQEGLVVLVPEVDEAWLIDEPTMTVKSRFATGGATSATAVPGSPVAYLAREGVLLALDLRNGDLTQVLAPAAVARAAPGILPAGDRPLSFFHTPTLTPDAKYLFCVDDTRLLRFGQRDGKWTWEDLGFPTGESLLRIEFSADSKRVAALARAGNARVPGEVDINNGVYVYAVTDLRRPKLALRTMIWPCLAFDPSSDRIFAPLRDESLGVFNAAGFKETQLPLGRFEAPMEMLVHPDGKKAVFLTPRGLTWIEFPAEPLFNVPADDPLSDRAGRAVETGKVLSSARQIVDGTTITTVPKDPSVVEFQSLLRTLWSGDGKFIYTLEESGILRRIAVPEFKEERRILLHHRCDGLMLTAEGLAVFLLSTNELCILDEATLALKRRFPVDRLAWLATSPALSIGFHHKPEGIAVLDLKTGKAGKTNRNDELSEQFWKSARRDRTSQKSGEFLSGMITADGKTLFCGSSDCLHRFSIRGQDLTLEESSPKIGGKLVYLNPAGDTVALVNYFQGNERIEGFPEPKKGDTYVFKGSDLQKPLFILSPGEGIRQVAFDPVGRRIFCMNTKRPVQVFDEFGKKERSVDLQRDLLTNSFLCSPSGSRVLLSDRSTLFLLELPE